MRVPSTGHATLRGRAFHDRVLRAHAAVARLAVVKATVAFAVAQAVAAALVASPVLAQPSPARPLPHNVEEPPVLATADAASPSPRVEVLTIDTRNTGVDLGLRRAAEGRDARAVAPMHVRMQVAGGPPAAPAAASVAGGVTAASSPAPAAESLPSAPGAAMPLPDDAASRDAAVSTADALDAPLSAASMNLDAVTAAAAAEASRNRNGTMVEGRIAAPRR
jgi:hypothetical protein